ncbi:MAG: hypothetical protein LE180_00745 [Endomicrobium sp.]|nr:hypothetical protein [Endomicrobium sp.]
MLAPANYKSQPIDIPYPKAYYRKFLTDEQKEQRNLNLFDKEIKRFVTPTELEKLKADVDAKFLVAPPRFRRLKLVAAASALIVERKLFAQSVRDSEREAVRRLFSTTFGDSTARRGVDDSEQIFGLPADSAGLDLPSQSTPEKVRKVKYDAVTGEIYCTLNDLTVKERESLDRVRRNQKIKKAWLDLSAIKNVKKEVKKMQKKKFEEVVDGEDRIIDLPNGRFIATNDWNLSDEELIAMYYEMSDDLVCYCPICNKNNNH